MPKLTITYSRTIEIPCPRTVAAMYADLEASILPAEDKARRWSALLRGVAGEWLPLDGEIEAHQMEE